MFVEKYFISFWVNLPWYAVRWCPVYFPRSKQFHRNWFVHAGQSFQTSRFFCQHLRHFWGAWFYSRYFRSSCWCCYGFCCPVYYWPARLVHQSTFRKHQIILLRAFLLILAVATFILFFFELLFLFAMYVFSPTSLHTNRWKLLSFHFNAVFVGGCVCVWILVFPLSFI